jgi:hypothetical protein
MYKIINRPKGALMLKECSGLTFSLGMLCAAVMSSGALITGALAPGCRVDDSEECRADEDCPGVRVCRDHLCQNVCENDDDCPEGERCVVTQWEPLLTVCTMSEDANDNCPSPLLRPEPDEPCLLPCNDNANCGPDQECIGGFCYDESLEADADVAEVDAE